MAMFTRLPIVVPSSGLPIVPSAEIEYLNDIMESTSFDHWLFDKGAESLTGRAHGQLLTAQAASPAYASNYLSLNNIKGNSLISTLLDRRELTMCVVVDQLPITGTKVLAGTANEQPAGYGSMIVSIAADLVGNQRPSAQVGPVVPGAGWQFIAYSESALSGLTTQILLRGGLAAVTRTGSPLKTLSTDTVAVGNRNFVGATVGSRKFAEFILFDRALSGDELQAVYLRSKTRLANRGISVV